LIAFASQQLVERDRQLADAIARRVENGVGDGSRNADDSNFIDSIRAQ
jgi:hypothetical protein